VTTTAPTPAPTAPVEPTPVQPEPPHAKPPPAHTPKDKPEVISGPARQALDEARHELESGNFEKSIRIASRAQNLQKTTEGRELLIQAHCSRHDLSNARKEWLKLPASRQKELQGFCARFDIELMK
jgi:serine/threonine-protein kinase